MKFSEYPQEIKDLVKTRIEEVENVYEESFLDEEPGAPKLYGGFDWDDTPEGFDFWESVLGDGDMEAFYTVYPKKDDK